MKTTKERLNKIVPLIQLTIRVNGFNTCLDFLEGYVGSGREHRSLAQSLANYSYGVPTRPEELLVAALEAMVLKLPGKHPLGYSGKLSKQVKLEILHLAATNEPRGGKVNDGMIYKTTGFISVDQPDADFFHAIGKAFSK